ncbi:hypothetical protein ACP4OV_006207 [Aristida adscensionis]
MDWAACVLPRHGEDAHFGHAAAGVVGVADGVGGCRDAGVDAGAFARALMADALAAAELAASGAGMRRRLRPEMLLARAYRKAVRQGTPGASTAVVVSLDGTALRWAYIGDSAFAVLRGGEIVHRSAPQRGPVFNCPLQLSSDSRRSDRLADAEVGGMPEVRDGDVLVVGTDGLFDNMHDADLELCVRMGMRFSPQRVADTIAAIAYEKSRNAYARSPFSMAYEEAFGEPCCGGKEDDITVIVAYIVSNNT